MASNKVSVHPSGGLTKRVLCEALNMFLAAPFGGVVLAAGLIFAVWSNAYLSDLAGDATNGDIEAILQGVRIGAVALWLSVALWGRQIMASARNRHESRERFDYYGSVIDRMQEALRREDEVKLEVTKKSRTFWDRFRSDPQL